MFQIGDKVVYPMHGAGVIIGKEDKEILGVIKEYYILKMPMGDMKISIPIDRISEMGIRGVCDHQMVLDIKSILIDVESDMSSNWNIRYKANLEKLRTGDLLEISKVFRDLYILDREKGLSMIEKKLLNTSKKMLISEIAIVENKSASKVEDDIIAIVET